MYPDFLLIGAQRAGSSWLSLRLRNHPEVLLPPIKELHYFDRKLEKSMFRTDFFSHKRKSLFKRMRKVAINMARQKTHGISWPIRFFLLRRSDEWYSRLFPEGETRLQGDCTPAYSSLDRETVAHIAGIMPSARILFVMRNPIQRCWSHAKMDLGAGGRPLESIPDEEYIAHIMSPGSQLRTDYLRTIDIWSSLFPPEQVKWLFFDALRHSPDEFMAEVCAFLGIGTVLEEPEQERHAAANVGSRYAMPEKVELHLCRMYHDKIRQMSERFGGYATGWLNGVEEVLSGREGGDER